MALFNRQVNQYLYWADIHLLQQHGTFQFLECSVQLKDRSVLCLLNIKTLTLVVATRLYSTTDKLFWPQSGYSGCWQVKKEQLHNLVYVRIVEGNKSTWARVILPPQIGTSVLGVITGFQSCSNCSSATTSIIIAAIFRTQLAFSIETTSVRKLPWLYLYILKTTNRKCKVFCRLCTLCASYCTMSQDPDCIVLCLKFCYFIHFLNFRLVTWTWTGG